MCCSIKHPIPLGYFAEVALCMIAYANRFLRTSVKQRKISHRFRPEINCFFQRVANAAILAGNDMFYYVCAGRWILVWRGILFCTRGAVTKIPKIFLNDCKG